MSKLSDLQLVLLSSAAQRDNGALLPVPPAVTATTRRVGAAITGLIRRGFAEKREHGTSITAIGRSAIGVDAGGSEQAPMKLASPRPVAEIEMPATPGTKSALVLTLLSRREGASVAELTEATGWLPHTTRAALTGLRKKGHDVTKTKVDEVTRYYVATAAA